MQSSVGNGGTATVPRMKRTVSAPGTSHSHAQRRSWRPPETVQARQTRTKTLPVVLENEIDDFNMLQVSTSPPQATPASVEKTRKAMQATLALLKKSTSSPTLANPNQSNVKEQQLPVPRLRKAIETRESGLAPPKTPNKQLRRRSHKAAITATNVAANAHAAQVSASNNNAPSTPTSKLSTPSIPTSTVPPLSAPAAISRPNQPTNIAIPKRTPSSNFLSSVGSGGRGASPSPRTVSAQSYTVSTPTPSTSTDPEPFRSSRNVSANDMVHAYYTILRERDPAHYLLNLNEEEEEIISQSQYAALLKLACQKFKRGDGRDRVALAYAEEMIGGAEDDSGW